MKKEDYDKYTIRFFHNSFLKKLLEKNAKFRGLSLNKFIINILGEYIMKNDLSIKKELRPIYRIKKLERVYQITIKLSIVFVISFIAWMVWMILNPFLIVSLRNIAIINGYILLGLVGLSLLDAFLLYLYLFLTSKRIILRIIEKNNIQLREIERTENLFPIQTNKGIFYKIGKKYKDSIESNSIILGNYLLCLN